MRSRVVLPLALALALFAAAAAPVFAACSVHDGDRVVLYSESDDPSVFVWDTRLRLRNYHAASFDEAKLLLPHASLVAPGTRAMVETCVAGFVQSPYFNGPDDAIGVVILGGPQRGRTGWVLGADVRKISRAAKH